MRGRCLLFGLGLILLFSAAASVAQTTGTIEGTVTDQGGGALPGVTVEIASPNLQGTRTATTSASGAYRFPTLPPGAYTITASLPGLGTAQKTATVTLDATATVNLSLALSMTAEVTVTGEAPLVDSTATTTGTNYTANVISRLPVGRNYADVVFTQPGVQADFGETQGRSLAISIYGSTSAENLFLIDGINTTNVIKGFQGKDINTEFIQEVEVKTGGYQAEYGRNTGGIVNVITKSGGNEFHGDVFGYYNDTGMRADPVNGDPAQYGTPIYSGTGSAQAQQLHPLQGRPAGVGARPRRLHGEGQGLVLRRLRPRAGQPEPPDARPDEHGDLRASIPQERRPVQVLGQDHGEPLPVNEHRRHRLLGRADPGRSPQGSEHSRPDQLPRPPGRRRPRLRRSSEPALRLLWASSRSSTRSTGTGTRRRP